MIKPTPVTTNIMTKVKGSTWKPKSFVEITDEEWFHFFEVNVLSGVRLSRHFLPKMLKQDWGRIIFISSESGVQIPSEMIHYGTTKTAQLGVARGLAQQTAGTNVTVNSVIPGSTRSEGAEKFINDLISFTSNFLLFNE